MNAYVWRLFFIISSTYSSSSGNWNEHALTNWIQQVVLFGGNIAITQYDYGLSQTLTDHFDKYRRENLLQFTEAPSYRYHYLKLKVFGLLIVSFDRV